MENIEIMSIIDADFSVLGTESLVTKKSSYIWLFIIAICVFVAIYFIYKDLTEKQEADI